MKEGIFFFFFFFMWVGKEFPAYSLRSDGVAVPRGVGRVSEGRDFYEVGKAFPCLFAAQRWRSGANEKMKGEGHEQKVFPLIRCAVMA